MVADNKRFSHYLFVSLDGAKVTTNELNNPNHCGESVRSNESFNQPLQRPDSLFPGKCSRNLNLRLIFYYLLINITGYPSCRSGYYRSRLFIVTILSIT